VIITFKKKFIKGELQRSGTIISAEKAEPFLKGLRKRVDDMETSGKME
jgi:hypothetical protein